MNDIIITDDIQILNGDLLVDISDIQNVEFILKSNLGQFYQYPDIGYGVNKRLNGKFDQQNETQNIKKALSKDGIEVSSVSIIQPTGDNIKVDVKFKRK